MAKRSTVRSQDVAKLTAKIRTLQRAVSKLRRRLEKYEVVEHEFYQTDSLGDLEKNIKFEKPDEKPEQEACLNCQGEVSQVSLGIYDYLICKGCLKRVKVA